MKTIIVVGLGNPGSRYGGTRHNIGFEVLDLFVKENGFPSFSSAKKLKSEVSEGIINEKKVVLIKPTTFMNLSGLAVKKVITEFNNSQLIVVHDDIDIALGKAKVSENRGPGGHKGVTSVIEEIGTKDFIRIRIGILPKKKINSVETFVLKSPPKDQKIKLQKAMKIAVSEIEKLIYSAL